MSNLASGSMDPLPGASELLAGVFLEAAPDGILVVDERHRIIVANKKMEELFSYDRQELLGQSIELLVPDRFRQTHEAYRSRYGEDPVERPMGLGLSLFGKRKDGSEFPVEIALRPVPTASGALIMAVVRDVTQHKLLEEERKALAIQLETEEERLRIGMDLHDGIMQAIYGTSLDLEFAAANVSTSPDEAQQAMVRAVDQLRDVLRDMRSMLLELKPRALNGSLTDSISELINEFQQNSALETTAHISNPLPDFGSSQAVSIYHIVEEVLSNIRKHSQATKVSVSLQVKEGRLCLEVIDNGVGFDPSAPVADDHWGLRNIRTRAQAANATVSIESALNSGTAVRVDIPL